MDNNNLEMLEMDKGVMNNVEGFGINKELIMWTTGVAIIAVGAGIITYKVVPMVSNFIKNKKKKHNGMTNSEKFQNVINLDKEHYTTD